MNSIEEDVLTLLNEELKLRSENLILELKRAVEGLRVEPTYFNDFTHYASMVLPTHASFCSYCCA